MREMKNTIKSSILVRGIILLAFTILTSFHSSYIQDEENPLSGWDRNILLQANSAATVSYLSDEEKKLIFYTNLCRLKPKLFCQTVLADYLNKHPDPTIGQPTIAALKRQLIGEEPGGALAPDEQLCSIARAFAKKMGQEGGTGHADFQNRMKPVMDRYNRVGENCDYGHTFAIDAFMNLLIDKSDPVNLAHRKNILDPKFTVIGVSKQPHKKFNYNFVIDFGGN